MELKKEFEQLFTKDATEITSIPKRRLTGNPQELWAWILNNFTPKVSRVEPPVKPEIAEDYSFAILILDDMRLKYFKHKDELENAKDVLLKNAKRLMYFKKDKNGYWIKPDTYEW